MATRRAGLDGSFERTSVVVPLALRLKMKEHRGKINWSRVACQAFVDALAAFETIGDHTQSTHHLFQAVEGGFDDLECLNDEIENVSIHDGATPTLATRPSQQKLSIDDELKGTPAIGEWNQLDRSVESNRISGLVFSHLQNHCVVNQPAWLFPCGVSYRCFPNDPTRVRWADAAMITLERMPVAIYRDERHCTTTPDLVVEVISPNDLAVDVDEKLNDWLAAGVKVLWEVYPGTRTIRAHRPDNTITLFRTADTLTAPDVLPGFSVPVAELFRLPGEPVAPAAAPVT